MKEIKSKKYEKIEKKSQFNRQDPGLPYGVSERTISEYAGDGKDYSRYNRKGFSEIDIPWVDFVRWYGEPIPIFNNIGDSPNVEINYTYDYIQDNSGNFHPENVKIVSGIIEGESIADMDLLAALGDWGEDKIFSDIEIDESDSQEAYDYNDEYGF